MVADITYLLIVTGDAYVSLVTGVYSRKIVDYHMDDNMKLDAVKQAYTQAFGQRETEPRLIHHSDRRAQYCSNEY